MSNSRTTRKDISLFSWNTMEISLRYDELSQYGRGGKMSLAVTLHNNPKVGRWYLFHKKWYILYKWSNFNYLIDSQNSQNGKFQGDYRAQFSHFRQLKRRSDLSKVRKQEKGREGVRICTPTIVLFSHVEECYY